MAVRLRYLITGYAGCSLASSFGRCLQTKSDTPRVKSHGTATCMRSGRTRVANILNKYPIW